MESKSQALPRDDSLGTTIFLLREYRRGNCSAFTRLYERHAPAVLRSVACRLGRHLRDLWDAEDILQEAFLAAWRYVDERRFEDFETIGGFRRLLVKIALQRISDEGRRAARLKRDHRRTVPLETAGDLVARGGGSPSEAARIAEIRKIGEEAMLRLSPADRRILDSRDNLEMAFDEIAKELGCRRDTAKFRYYRAKQRLQTELRDMGCA